MQRTVPASSRPVVLVVRADVAVRDIAEAAARELTARLESRGFVLLPRTPPRESQDAVLARIEAAFFALETERALGDIRTFLTQLEHGEHGLVTQAVLVRALLLLAQASAASSDGAASDEAIDRVLVAAPGIELDEARHSPVLREHLAARRARPSRARCALRVEDVPVEGRVLVDGEVPATRASVIGGPRIVQIDVPGYALETYVVDPCDHEVTVTFAGGRTAESLDALAGDPFGPVPRALTEALTPIGVDAYFLDARVSGGRVLYRFSHADVVEHETALDTSAARVADVLDEGTRARADDASRATRRRRRAAIIATSVGVAAGAITTGIVFAPRGPDGFRGQGTIEGEP